MTGVVVPEEGVAAVEIHDGRRSPSAQVEDLYRSEARSLLLYFAARVPDLEVATDLLAETFAQVVCGIGRMRADTPEAARAWVWGIARNLVRRYYRDERAARTARDRLGVVVVRSAPGPDEDGGPDPALGEELQRALAELPPATRQSVWMRLAEERPYAEIAEHMGCTEVAARQRVARGLRHLSAELADPRRDEEDR